MPSRAAIGFSKSRKCRMTACLSWLQQNAFCAAAPRHGPQSSRLDSFASGCAAATRPASLSGRLRVNLGCRDICMAEQGLQAAKVGVAIQHMGRKPWRTTWLTRCGSIPAAAATRSAQRRIAGVICGFRHGETGRATSRTPRFRRAPASMRRWRHEPARPSPPAFLAALAGDDHRFKLAPELVDRQRQARRHGVRWHRAAQASPSFQRLGGGLEDLAALISEVTSCPTGFSEARAAADYRSSGTGCRAAHVLDQPGHHLTKCAERAPPIAAPARPASSPPAGRAGVRAAAVEMTVRCSQPVEA